MSKYDTYFYNYFRATTALRLRFEVCPELRNHLELLPKTGYIQAQSTFSAQLKFLPRSNLAEEAGKYFDPETGVLQAPLVITVADQVRPRFHLREREIILFLITTGFLQGLKKS